RVRHWLHSSWIGPDPISIPGPAGSYFLLARAGHDLEVHSDLVLDLHRAAPRRHRFHPEVAVPQDRLARGRERAVLHLDAERQREGLRYAGEGQVAGDLRVGNS